MLWENEHRVRECNLSLEKDRHKLTLNFWRIWKDLRVGRQPEHWTSEVIEQGKQKALIRLADLCQHELVEAVLENRIGAGLLGFRGRRDGERVKVTGDFALLFGSVREAAETVTNYRQRAIHEHVKFCMAEKLACAVDNFNKWFNEADAKHLLPLFLSLPRYNTALLVTNLSGEQRSDLIALLHDQLTDEPTIFLRMDEVGEPKKPELWLYWYLYLADLKKHREKFEEELGGVPRYLIATRRGAIPTDKDGKLLDPLGPIHAKIYQRLGRELNKHGHRFKEPESKSKLAKSIRTHKDAKGVDRSTLNRYLKADIPVPMDPDGEGGVYYDITSEAINQSIKVVRGQKRGRKPKNS